MLFRRLKFLTLLEQRILEQFVISYPITFDEVWKCYNKVKSFDILKVLLDEVYETNRTLYNCLGNYLRRK